MKNDESIEFYSVNEAYGEFSNFADYPIEIDSIQWPTSEHYFQAMKFADRHYAEKIRKARGAYTAAQMGRDRSVKIKRGWDDLRIQVMTIAVRAKFNQHPELAILLLSTGNRKIVEHTENDRFWGDGGNGKGKNMLGIILMKIRNELAAQPDDTK